MAITTNAELETAIGNWLDRTDLSSRIPEFVVLAEARFNRVVRAPDMLTRDDAFTIDGQYETVPTGFLEAKRIVLSTSPVTSLEYVTPDAMADMQQTRSATGRPRYYTVSGGSFEFFPVPSEAFTASVLYYARLTPVATSFNWLATSHPDVYLYGALVQAEPYLRNDDRLPVWRSQLDQALSELAVLNDRKQVQSGSRPFSRLGGFE